MRDFLQYPISKYSFTDFDCDSHFFTHVNGQKSKPFISAQQSILFIFVPTATHHFGN